MATINKITEIIAAIKTIYPYYAKESDVPTLVKTWEALLREYPDNAVDVALYKCLQTCKTPPTPADLIEKLDAMHKALEPTDEELWTGFVQSIIEAERQIYRFDYNFVESNGLTQGQNARNKVEEIWQAVPEKVKQYIGSKGEFIRMAQRYRYSDDELKFEKNRFLKTMPTIQKRNEYKQIYSLLEGGKGGQIAFGTLHIE